jgi:raffinose/stachyose/melibiose transport system substrate-binding protein
VFKGGNLNEDFGVAKFGNGVRMVATGEAAHYPMLTFALGNVKQNFAENRNDVVFFAQPGPDAANNGLTVWMPAALYIPAASQNHEAAKDFMSFVASVEGCNRMIGANGAAGPLPDQGLRASSRCAARSGRHAALLPGRKRHRPSAGVPVADQGPALEQITVEAGSGIRRAAEAAVQYNDDVEKRAKQLGLPNW